MTIDDRLRALLNRILSARSQGKLQEAAALARTALQRAPDSADVLHIAGVIAHELGNAADALDLIGRAIANRPGDPRLHRSRGVVALALGQVEVARDALNVALQANPADAALAQQVAKLFVQTGDNATAAALLERAAAAAGDPNLMLEAGNLLVGLERFDEAVRVYRRAATATPTVPILSNLASALTRLGRIDEAAQVFEQAIKQPTTPADGAKLAFSFGRFLQGRNDDGRATRMFETAVSLDPDRASYRRALAMHLLATQGATHEAVWHLARALEADTRAFDDTPDAELVPVLMSLLYVDRDAGHQRQLATRWARTNGPVGPAPAVAVTSSERLRIGYVSADFCDHVVANFVTPILEEHDRTRFDIIGYSLVARPDAVTGRIAAACNEWLDATSLDDDALAERIRHDRIDVLVDLMGLTSGSRPRLFQRRPAPIQVTYLGYPGTTGLTCFDARIVDEITDPPGMTDADFSEPLLRLPTSFIAYRPIGERRQTDQDPPCIARGHVTFGSFNNAAKITRPAMRVWGRILARVPNSRLRIKSLVTENPAIVAELRRVTQACGIPQDRLDIVPPAVGSAAHLASYDDVDVALDCFPYNGTTTTCEALRCGVPVVTIAGRSHASRVSASILIRASLGELVASDEDSLVEIATRLARSPELLKQWRRELGPSFARSPVCDARSVTRALESAFRDLVRGKLAPVSAR